MNIAKRNIYIGLLTMFLPLVCSLSFTSCSDDYKDQVSGSETAGMRLRVSANSMGGIGVSRAYNGDENAEEGEFIHSLCVYVVEKESGLIVKKYCTDDVDYPLTFTQDEQELANAGNLLEWTSDERLKLAADKTYIIYAFANWETTWAVYFDTYWWEMIEPMSEDEIKNDPWYKLIYNKSEGGTITEDDINFSVDHPADKIDIGNALGYGAKYIPMSGRLEITGGHTAVTVELIRLVAKVEMTMQMDISGLLNDEINYYYPLEWAELGTFAEMVPLFEGGTIEEKDLYYGDLVGWPNVSYLYDYPLAPRIPVNSNEAYSIDKRYVNETNLDNIPSYNYYYDYPGFFSRWYFFPPVDENGRWVAGFGDSYLDLSCYSTIREFKRNEYWKLEHAYTGSELILTDVINWGNYGEEIIEVFEIED